jgi:hypothetical protein
MLYEDKFGTFWEEEELNTLSPSKIRDLQIHQSIAEEEYF